MAPEQSFLDSAYIPKYAYCFILVILDYMIFILLLCCSNIRNRGGGTDLFSCILVDGRGRGGREIEKR